MHRHGYQGRKLSREMDQRKALIRGLVTSLILHEQIATTEAKAKEVGPYLDRMVTMAKKNDLHHHRQLRSFILTENAVQKLIQELVPAFAERSGGYTRITKAGNRRGDNAPLAVISLVLPAKPAAAKKATESAEKTSVTPETESNDSKKSATTKEKAGKKS